jgi:hypothetical protein
MTNADDPTYSDRVDAYEDDYRDHDVACGCRLCEKAAAEKEAERLEALAEEERAEYRQDMGWDADVRQARAARGFKVGGF